MLHGKAILGDDEIAMTGSANIDLRSLFVNYELGAFFYSRPDIDEIKNWIHGLITNSESYSDTSSEKRPLLKSVAEDISQLLTPLL